MITVISGGLKRAVIWYDKLSCRECKGHYALHSVRTLVLQILQRKIRLRSSHETEDTGPTQRHLE